MKTAAKENLLQIRGLIKNLKDDDYKRQPEILGGATIGQHIRHVLEFYLMLVSDSFSGNISYEKRKRDIEIEINRDFAIQMIDSLITGINSIDESLPVDFDADYSTEGNARKTNKSTVGRELAFCIEHSIHHQAIIRAALISLGLKDITDDNFGVAYSTIRYRIDQCVQ